MKGNTEPRIFTPPLRKLTKKTSLGYLFAEFCQDVCEIELLPWQEWLAIHALEIVGDFEKEWSFRFRKVIVLIARQNGKSLFAELLSLFFMYVLGVRLVLGTAQNLDTAEEVWDAAIDRAESNDYMQGLIDRIGKVNGKKSFELKNGAKYKIVAATRKGARGKRSDLVLIDELREQTNWEGWSAVSKTINARPNGILFAFSNAGDAQSVVLRHFRMLAHKDLGDPDGIAAKVLEALPTPTDEDGEEIDLTDDTLALFEWSADSELPVIEPKAWAQANPSLGYGFMTERALRSDAISEPEAIFRTECLCQWVEAVTRSVFPDGAWERWQDNGCEDEDAEYYWGIDMNTERTQTAIAFVARRSDGSWHGEVEAYRTGFDWALKLLSKNAPMNIALQGRGAPISSHIDELRMIDGLNITLCEGRDVAAWTGRFYDAICADEQDVKLHHIPQPALDYAASIAKTKQLGDGAWAWDRRNSETDISPLIALTMAYGLATVGRTETKVYKSTYNERGVRTV